VTKRSGHGSTVVAAGAAALRRRLEAFVRYGQWEEGRHPAVAPAAAVASLGFIYDLLPADARRREVDPTGVQIMHRCLAVLKLRRA
jgi:hypothetical protein